MRIYLIPLCGALMLSGCMSGMDTATQSLNLVSSATDVKYYYQDGELLTHVKQANLSDWEAIELAQAVSAIEASEKKLRAYERQPLQIIPNLPLIQVEYDEIKRAYMVIRELVSEHQGDYSAAEWATLTRFDVAVQVLDESFNELVKASEANAATLTALKLADTTIKLVGLL